MRDESQLRPFIEGNSYKPQIRTVEQLLGGLAHAHAYPGILHLGDVQEADLYTSIHLLYPFAGMVLIACALRSLLRYRQWTTHAWAHALQVALGLGLALLWLLDLGAENPQLDAWQRDISRDSLEARYVTEWKFTPTFDLAKSGWSSWIVLGVYGFSAVFTTALAVCNIRSTHC